MVLAEEARKCSERGTPEKDISTRLTQVRYKGPNKEQQNREESGSGKGIEGGESIRSIKEKSTWGQLPLKRLEGNGKTTTIKYTVLIMVTRGGVSFLDGKRTLEVKLNGYLPYLSNEKNTEGKLEIATLRLLIQDVNFCLRTGKRSRAGHSLGE